MVTVEVQVQGLTSLLSALTDTKRHIGYVVVNALNETAKRIQKSVRENVQRRFTLRGTHGAFVLRQAAIITFANFNAGRFMAVIRVGQKSRLLLSAFEQGGERRPFVGKNIAVPLVGGARATQADSVPSELYVQKLGLRRAKGKTRGGRTILIGNIKTYLIGGVGIFQQAPGSAHARMLYAFIPRAKLDPRLGFIDTARHVALQFQVIALDLTLKELRHNLAKRF